MNNRLCTEVEFEIGQEVTFCGYRGSITAKVVNVYPTCDAPPFRNDVSYDLLGLSEPLTTNTTGRSIMESKYFTVGER